MSRAATAFIIPFLVATLSAGDTRAAVFEYTVSEDSYIVGGAPNSNNGTSNILRVRTNGPTRTLARVDAATLFSDLDGAVVNSATLTFFVESASNWGVAGRAIDVHRVATDWNESEVTWASPETGGPAWDGGGYLPTPTDSYTQTNALTGTVSFDVTADVAAFISEGASNFGWLVRKNDESENGGVVYTSREGAIAANRPMLEVDVDFIACPSVPQAPCRASILEKRSLLLVKDKGDKDQLIFKWIKGEETDLADLGDPLASTTYTVCVWDSIADTPELVYQAIIPPGGTCDGKDCWKTAKNGFNYKDPDVSAEGMKILILRAGAEGKAKMIAKGQGPGLNLPSLPLAQDQTVIAQVKSDHAGGACFEARFSGPAKKNDDELFKDKGDAPLP